MLILNNKLKVFTFLSLIIALINYSPIIYYFSWGQVSGWANFYSFPSINSNELWLKLFDKNSVSKNFKAIKFEKASKNNYLKIVLQNTQSKQFYEIWIYDDTLGKFSALIVLSRIGQDTTKQSFKSINKEYTLINNYFNLKEFEETVLNELPSFEKN